MAVKRILVSDTDDSEAKNDFETDMVQWEKGGKYLYSDVGRIKYRLTMKYLHQ